MKTKTVYSMIVLVSCIMSACSTIPTSGTQDISSSTIAYFFREGLGPTIVFQSGLGDGKDVWGKTIKQLPDSVSIFLYDRPGYGDSSKTVDSRDPCAISRELNKLLQEVGVTPPYILVGHSLGSLYQFYYASLFPDEVAGLVLLDPTPPDHWEATQSEATAQANIIKGLRNIAFSPVMRQEFDDHDNCSNVLRGRKQNELPSILLFSGQFQIGEKGPYEIMLRKLRKEWGEFLINAKHAEIARSGHYIQKDAPEMVSAAIEGMITGYPNDAWRHHSLSVKSER